MAFVLEGYWSLELSNQSENCIYLFLGIVPFWHISNPTTRICDVTKLPPGPRCVSSGPQSNGKKRSASVSLKISILFFGVSPALSFLITKSSFFWEILGFPPYRGRPTSMYPISSQRPKPSQIWFFEVEKTNTYRIPTLVVSTFCGERFCFWVIPTGILTVGFFRSQSFYLGLKLRLHKVLKLK
ncbi:MAG: hypothetical protein CM15mP71_3920 [Candidatus Poseidoniales archaeon]|nr:MAG: hypothetical protein CM15mP71_3920 [Candidatus Poseidoniales archaeon]